jgi:hypothetical protein
MSYDRFLHKLIEQFEELQQLRDRVRKAEAKALNNQRSCSRRQKRRAGSLRRNSRRVRAAGLSTVG